MLNIIQVDVNGNSLYVLGNPDLLQERLVGIFCSQKCPGELILKAFDLAKELREKQVPVTGGFHASVEKEMLPVLMRGSQPVVICLARSLESYRIPIEYRSGLDEGRLLLVSPFSGKGYTRITKETAALRNRLIGNLSSSILIIYAQPGGGVERLCQEWLSNNRKVFALLSQANQYLFQAGVKAWD